MNIYKLTNPHIGDYNFISSSTWDIYLGAVVYAETEEQARFIHPNTTFGEFNNGLVHDPHDEWCLPSEVIVKFLGTNKLQKESGVILVSQRM